MYDLGKDFFSRQWHEARQNACAEGWVWQICTGQAEFLHVSFLPDFYRSIVLFNFFADQTSGDNFPHNLGPR